MTATGMPPADRAPGGLRILFSMRHSGALRNFSSTIRALAAAGHQVQLAFMLADKRGDGRLLRDLLAEHPQIVVTPAPAKRPLDGWGVLARGVRTIGDYLRYWTPEYADAEALRERAASRVPPAIRGVLDRHVVRTPSRRDRAERLCGLLERALPIDPRVAAQVALARPDVVLVTPLVEIGSDQVDYVKAARTQQVHSGLAVHSWDNLTNKGRLRVLPDRIYVWNEAQKREAIRMHGAAAGGVVVTGAPVYDQWFERRPSTTREEFCRKAGLRADRPFILYLCSSGFIAGDETVFVAEWARAIRSAPDARLREAGLLVRPHPDIPGPWQAFDESPFPGVAIWPRGSGEPIDQATKDDYFDSIYHAAAAVGINTSAQIETGIVGRPVFSIRVPAYAGTQDGTLHFAHLLADNGGPLHVSANLEAHLRDLAAVLDGVPEEERRRVRRFVEAFVRPFGLHVAATPRLAEDVVALGRLPRPAPERRPASLRAVRLLLHLVAFALSAGRPAGRAAGKRPPDAPPRTAPPPAQRVSLR